MQQFKPIDLIVERVGRNGGESDVARFWELTYAGEFIIKLTAAALVACVDDSRDRDRYGLEYRLVRADGIGEWVQVIEQALTGPPAAHLNPAARDLRNELTRRASEGWIAEAVDNLISVLQNAYDLNFNAKEKPSLRLWFNLFVQLRNKARGHGAPTPARLSSCVLSLDKAVDLVVGNLPIKNMEWAYLHRNLSGKYRVIPLTQDAPKFEELKTAKAQKSENLPSGVYLWLSKPRRVDLVYTDQDCLDYFFPNGDFKAGDFELHSLITDDRRREPNIPYLAPATAVPESETEGRSELEAVGNVLTNIPAASKRYIARRKLEQSVQSFIENDRHPIVTLVGRGGIGKTSLTLNLLNNLAYKDRFDLVIWFSARDIDLIPSGAKQVRPAVLTEREISARFMSLLGAPTHNEDGKKIDQIEYMAARLRQCEYGPTLFVFDNFETLRNPQDVYSWIDSNIRLPNKVLITSRFRDFKGDYPVEISGMEKEEGLELIDMTARELKVFDQLNSPEKNTLFEESEGHPYIIKILLGEIADSGNFSRPSKLIARRDDVLNALFERTFGTLSPLASRIFMTLSQWRSAVPQLVVEAALLRHAEGGLDPESAIDQLVRTSLVERSQDTEAIDHLMVPLSAAIFGKAKLEVAANRALIMEDVRFLQTLGASDLKTDNRGFLTRLKRLFADIAHRVEEGETSLVDVRPVLEFLAGGYAETWLLMSKLENDSAQDGWEERSGEYLRRYLQDQPTGSGAHQAWQSLEALYKQKDDAIAGCGAFLRAAEFSEPPLERVSSMANWLNSSYRNQRNLPIEDRSAVFLPLANLLEAHLDAASATDLSRLGWLYLNCGDVERAKQIADLGIARDPDNLHCARLNERLESQ